MRITAGEYRGRRLSVPKGRDVRPTTDMVRQAVFNILLQYDLPGDAVVFDGFCGTGALGLEALSRGASACVFVDKDIRPVRENAGILGVLDQCTFIEKDVRKVVSCPERDDVAIGGRVQHDRSEDLDGAQEKASLLFLDPPYRQDLISPALTALADKCWLAPGCVCVMEAEKTFTLCPPDGFSFLGARAYGDSQIILCRYKSAPEGQAQG